MDDIPGGGRDGERRDGGGGGQVEEDFDDLDDEQDEMADFIVEGDGAPRRRNRRKAAAIPGVSSRAMQVGERVMEGKRRAAKGNPKQWACGSGEGGGVVLVKCRAAMEQNRKRLDCGERG